MPDQRHNLNRPRQGRSLHDGVRLLLLLLVPCAMLLARPADHARAQEELCFPERQPDITACVSGRFRGFWEEQGGLAVFGYPLTDATLQTTSEGLFLTQYFERARFELHPELPAPYDVLLGRLGVERLRVLGEDWTSQPRETPDAGCQFWAETGHNVCGAFLGLWRASGLQLDDDPALGDAERLALWGLPLTALRTEQTAAGPIQVQWFERVRFEQQPDGSLTIGLLGDELVNAPAQVPTPTPAPLPPAPTPESVPTPPPPAPTPIPPAPGVPFPSIPCNRNVPAPAEGLQVWMTDPNPSIETDAVACVRLIVRGQPALGASAVTYRYVGAERIPSIYQTLGLEGVASFIFYIRELGGGATVPVEAVVTYQGVTYVGYTEFRTR